MSDETETVLTETEKQELFKGLTETEKQELINLFSTLTSNDDEQVEKFTRQQFYELAYNKGQLKSDKGQLKSEKLNELAKILMRKFTLDNKILSTTYLLSLFKEIENDDDDDVLYKGLDQDEIDYLKLLLKRDLISFLQSLKGISDYKFTLKQRDIEKIEKFLNEKTHKDNFSLNFLFENLTFSIKQELLKLIEELTNNSFKDIYKGLYQNEIDDLKLLLKRDLISILKDNNPSQISVIDNNTINDKMAILKDKFNISDPEKNLLFKRHLIKSVERKISDISQHTIDIIKTELEDENLLSALTIFNDITKPGYQQMNNNEKMSILTYFTILHMLFPNEFTSGNSENIKKIVEFRGIEQIPEYFYDFKDDEGQKLIVFFNRFINNHYTRTIDELTAIGYSKMNISSIETIKGLLTGVNNQKSIPILIEASKLYFEQLKKLLINDTLLVLREHPLSNIDNLYTRDNITKTVNFNETPDNYNTIILVILISELIAINKPDYIKTIFMNAATKDGQSSSAEAQQDGQPGSADGQSSSANGESSSAEAQQNVQQDSADGQPGSADGQPGSANGESSSAEAQQELQSAAGESLEAGLKVCRSLLDDEMKKKIITNLQTTFGITINTDDTVSNKIISDIVTYIEMITNEKQLKSNKLNPQGGKKSRKKRRKKTRKKKKQTKKRKTKRFKKPTKRRK